MAKTQKELDELKKEYEILTDKLQELSDDELRTVCAGINIWDIATKLKEKFGMKNAGIPLSPDEKLKG